MIQKCKPDSCRLDVYFFQICGFQGGRSLRVEGRLPFWINRRNVVGPILGRPFLVSISFEAELSLFPCAALLTLWSVPMLCYLLPLLNYLLSARLVPFFRPPRIASLRPSGKACLHTMIHISSSPCLPNRNTYLIVFTLDSLLDYKLFSLFTTLGRL